METFFRCAECSKVIRVVGSDSEVTRITAADAPFYCPWCNSVGTIIDLQASKSFHGISISTQQFWLAANGAGLPEEIEAVKETIPRLLLEHKVVSVESEFVDDRCVLKAIGLSDGSVLKLAASGYGAIVFKVVKKGD